MLIDRAKCAKSEHFSPFWGRKWYPNVLKIIEGELMKLWHPMIPFSSLDESPKWQKRLAFCTLRPVYQQTIIFWFFTHRCRFGGLPGIRSGKFQFLQKVDTQSFPTSYHEPHFDTEKAAKCFRKVRGPFGDENLKYFCNFWTSKIRFFQMSV